MLKIEKKNTIYLQSIAKLGIIWKVIQLKVGELAFESN